MSELAMNIWTNQVDSDESDSNLLVKSRNVNLILLLIKG